MTEPSKKAKTQHCDECKHEIKPGEPHYPVAGLTYCSVCWGMPPHKP